MRKTIVALLELGAWIWLLSQITVGVFLGGTYFAAQPYLFDQGGAIFGAAIGLMAGVVTTGLIFLLIDIRVYSDRYKKGVGAGATTSYEHAAAGTET